MRGELALRNIPRRNEPAFPDYADLIARQFFAASSPKRNQFRVAVHEIGAHSELADVVNVTWSFHLIGFVFDRGTVTLGALRFRLANARPSSARQQ